MIKFHNAPIPTCVLALDQSDGLEWISVLEIKGSYSDPDSLLRRNLVRIGDIPPKYLHVDYTIHTKTPLNFK